MKHRAIKNLNQLSDKDLYKEISVGLEKIHENCLELNRSSHFLFENKKYQALKIIEAISKEEAAKYLILIDVLRCPRKQQHQQFTRQLDKFNDHLAKGIYAELCGWNPHTYKELCEYIRPNLDTIYLDGPLDVDFIFRNQIIAQREEAFYVDYAQIDDGHSWLSPQDQHSLYEDFPFYYLNPSVISIVKALHSLGISKLESIEIFSTFWRDFEFNDDTHYQELRKANAECLKLLDAQNLLNNTNATQDECNLVVNKLPFPLYKEAMKEIEVKISELKEQQQNWCPGY
jgi:AbiV family abortive infection protein